MNRMTDDEIARELRELEGWTRTDNWIEKKYVFKSFVRAMLFAGAAGWAAESVNHHPDFIIHYNEVTVRNWTHMAGGITRLDFVLARKIDDLVREDDDTR